jgi:pimeloyl-ACP methyl ester carboxylesterase
MADIVLVHGTTQGSAGFARLAAALRRRGHRPLTVDVPGGLGAGSVEYADLLAARLPDDLDRPVVAAHSAGGLLLPALAARLDAAHQVWLAAVVPDFAGGRSFLTELRADPGAVVDPEWIGVDPTRDPAAAAHFLFHDADPATLREALTTVALCDLSSVYAEAPPLDPAARPSTYALPTGDRTLRPSWMAAAARERLGVEPVELPGGHNNHVAHAEEVAATIAAAAERG